MNKIHYYSFNLLRSKDQIKYPMLNSRGILGRNVKSQELKSIFILKTTAYKKSPLGEYLSSSDGRSPRNNGRTWYTPDGKFGKSEDPEKNQIGNTSTPSSLANGCTFPTDNSPVSPLQAETTSSFSKWIWPIHPIFKLFIKSKFFCKPPP